MAIQTTCGGCGKMLSVGDEHAGHRARCPACGQIYTIPLTSQAAPPTIPIVPASDRAASSLAETTAGIQPQATSADQLTDQFWMKTPQNAEYGPVDRATLNRWFSEGRVGPDYQIRQSELGMWQAADMFKPGSAPRPAPMNQFTGSANPYAAVNVQQASYPAAGYMGSYAKPDQSGLVLAFGILSWFICPIFGIVAWVMGRAGLRDIAVGLCDPANKGLMQVGYYLGMVHVLLCSVCICGYFAIVAIALVGSSMN